MNTIPLFLSHLYLSWSMYIANTIIIIIMLTSHYILWSLVASYSLYPTSTALQILPLENIVWSFLITDF